MDPRPKLTDRQKSVYDFIVERIAACGYAPSIREMCIHLDIRSTNGVADHLKALVRKGYLTKEGKRSRTWQPRGHDGGRPTPAAVAPTTARAVRIPLLGTVAAGQPLLAEEQAAEVLHIDPDLVPRGRALFALRVAGDSMIEAGICSGDLLFVDRRDDAESGQIVVALIDGEATVKYFIPEAKAVRLRPANHTMEDIVVRARERRSLQLMGVVVGVYRRL